MFRTAFCIGIFNSKNLPIFLLRRFMPLFIIPLSTLEVNDFQPMGITPAYAGKREFKHTKGRFCRDHPRLCGEKQSNRQIRRYKKGSPPPMRGKVCRRDAPENRGRITPAYAGKRSTPSRFPEKQQDHPRLCGEKFQSVHRWTFFIGSPPPMRGKEFCNACKVVNFRDHPRLCGEKVKRSSVSLFLLGSPPPMRGKEPTRHIRAIDTGITPAYAGKSMVIIP